MIKYHLPLEALKARQVQSTHWRVSTSLRIMLVKKGPLNHIYGREDLLIGTL